MANKKRGRISKAFKREVAIEYVQGGVTMQDLALKYHLPNAQTVSNWKKCYLSPEEIQNKKLSLPTETKKEEDMGKKTGGTETVRDPEITRLEERIAQLERQLYRSEMKNKALNTILDIAEEQGLKLRKKPGVRQ